MKTEGVDISPVAVDNAAAYLEETGYPQSAAMLRAIRRELTASEKQVAEQAREIERLKKFEPVCHCDPTGWNLNPIPPPCRYFEWDGGSDKVKVCVRCEHDETCHGEKANG